MIDRIRTVLDYSKLSQRDFAQKLGISASALSSIFTGRTKPTQKQVIAIHNTYPEINVSWLMFGEGDMLTASAFSSAGEADNLAGAQGGVQTAENAAEKAEVPVTESSLFSPSAMPQPAIVGAKRTQVRPMYAEAQAAMKNAIYLDKANRKIKEIRVFYDDGTYESYGPSGR